MHPADTLAHAGIAAPSASLAALRAELVTSIDGLHLLADDWRALFHRAQCRHPFLSEEWLSGWFAQWGAERSLFVVAVRNEEDRLVALAPLSIERTRVAGVSVRRLCFLGDRWVGSDYLGVLVEPDAVREAIACIASIIDQHREAWDYVELQDADADQPALDQLRRALGPFTTGAGTVPASVCPYALLPSAFDSYLSGLGPKLRKNIRRLRRLLETRGKVEWCEYRTGPQLTSAYEEFLALHRLRFTERKETSTFLDESVQAFHRVMLTRLAQLGWVRLYLLRIDGRAIAGLLGYAIRDKFLFYQSGMDPAWAKLSPGVLLVARTLEQSIKMGHAEYDFLRGSEGYKRQWAGQLRQTATLTLYGFTLRALYARVAHGWRRYIPKSRDTHAMVTRAGAPRSQHPERVVDGLRRAIKQAWVAALSVGGAFWWARRRLAQEGAIVVLMFHRVLPDQECAETDSLPGIVIREKTFASLMGYAARHADVVSMTNACPAEAGRTRKPRLAFTFDDGWEDNARVAYPVAAGLGLPFTIFVCPGLMDTHQPFWPERAVRLSGMPAHAAQGLIESLKRLPSNIREDRLEELSREPTSTPPPMDRTMNWDTARQLRDGGVSFGSHSYAHEILTFLTPCELSDDLVRSRQSLQAALGTECRILAYPNGNASRRVEAAAAAAGYTLAVTTRETIWTRDSDPYRVPRVNMWEGIVTAPSGRFSSFAFQYAAYWRPFMTWVSEAHGRGRLARFLGY